MFVNKNEKKISTICGSTVDKSCITLNMKKIFITLLGFCFIFTFVACSKKDNIIELSKNLTNYEIDLELNTTSMSVVAKQKVDYRNSTTSILKNIKFHLYPQFFKEGASNYVVPSTKVNNAYPNGMSYGDINISQVAVEGKEVDHEICGQDKNILSVKLNKQVFPDESIKLSINFTLKLANVVARTGYNNSTINLANFYPILCVYENGEFYECVYYDKGDPFYSECANYKVSITCDKEYQIASSGGLVKNIKNDSTQTATFKLDSARSFAFVLSKNFSVISDKTTGVNINYYYYQDQNPQQSIEYAIKAVKLFGSKFGDFPYNNYSVVQTEFVQGGMEFPALVMISDELTDLAYGEVIVHETAHQFWQTAVGNNEIEHSFLDEGLAEYSVVLFYENYSEYGYTRQNLIKSSEQTYKIFCSVSDKLYNKVNTVMLRDLSQFSSEYEYVNIAYIKPCIMFDSLRTTIGDVRFFDGLKRYYNNYKFKIAKPDNLVGAFEKIGADTNGFFHSFFEGKVII